MDYNFFWIDALKDEGSSEWYWETSGNMIKENDLYWGRFQPSLENETVRTCINISYFSGGYDDDGCSDYLLDVICQTSINK